MKKIRSLGDQREVYFCAFCGGKTGTRDHCPSKIFLEQPFPENLPVVPACEKCNNSFSVHEEYMACLIACVLSGSTEPELISSQKIAKILKRKEYLRLKINNSILKEGNKYLFEPEIERVEKVLTKLAQGHSLFELHLPVHRNPDSISFFALPILDRQQRLEFELPPEPDSMDYGLLLPEVGSRAMTRMFTGTDVSENGWIVVQQGTYRFLALQNTGVEVRIVFSEYLGCVVRWDE
jgi:hypothetical protein